MIVDDFKSALDQAGLHTKQPIVSDGKIHRFHIEGDKKQSKNGWYVLYPDTIPAGAFGCWKRGIKETWCSQEYTSLSFAQKENLIKKSVQSEKLLQKEMEARNMEAQRKAAYIWHISKPAPDKHPYLVKKNVCAHGIRLYKGSLIIPLKDEHGTLFSLQFIDPEGNKRFLSGGRKIGCFYLIGLPVEPFCIVEGFATGATVYEETLYPVVVAFDTGNLLPVGKAIQKHFLQPRIIYCADNDTETDGNPGLTKATQAAETIGASLVVPPISGDFNDYYVSLRG